MTDLPPNIDPAPLDMDEYRRRQRDRSRIMGLALLGLVVLIFFVTIAKIEFAT
jgi:hypothetical protein